MSTERMQKARTGLIIAEPFFGSLSMKLDLVEDPKTETCWTDGKRLGFRPEWAELLPMEQLEAVFAHEIAHCAFGHHLRRNGRDPKTWNEACDHAVNHELRRAGFHLPSDALMDPQFDGMHAEAIYATIMDQKSQEQPQAPGSPQSDQKGDGDAKGKGEGSQAQDGAPGKGESSTGRVDDAKGDDGGEIDDAELAEQEADWQNATAQAAQVARAAGKMPGGIENQVDAFINARVDWREALQRYIKGKAKDDYSWSRPNRRYMQSGYYLPSLESPRVGPLAFAMDWSGSTINRAADFISEVEEARQMVSPEKIILMIFDTQVRQVLEFEADQPIDLSLVKARAGGGTSFDGPARKLEQMDVTPEALIFLTDLDSSVFGPEPNYPVLWVSTLGSDAPFGEVIMMQP